MSFGDSGKCPGKCIYKIPLFGGCCAPTENPDESCFRHCSNEWTLIGSGGGTGPFGRAMPCLETSFCCRMIGSIGISTCDRNRKVSMSIGCLCNFISMVLTIIAAMGISDDVNQISTFHWVHGAVAGKSNDWQLYMGVTALVLEVNCTRHPNKTHCSAHFLKLGFEHVDGHVYTFQHLTRYGDASCKSPDHFNADLAGASVWRKSYIRKLEKQCNKCMNHIPTSLSLIVGIICTIPAITSTLQRTTHFGDVNCQSTNGSIMTCFSVVTTAVSLTHFTHMCKAEMLDVLVDTDGKMVPIKWGLGPGFQCLLAATVMKVIPALVHFLVPTPPGRWKPAATYDLLAYMKDVDGLNSDMKDAGGSNGDRKDVAGFNGDVRDVGGFNDDMKDVRGAEEKEDSDTKIGKSHLFDV